MVEEKRAHNWYVELRAVKHIDPHSYSSYQHGCIQHRVEAPMHDRELNENNHGARHQHPLKTIRNHKSEKNTGFLSRIATRKVLCHHHRPSHFDFIHENSEHA